MIEKVNPAHPDKICDRIAGAIVDQAYREDKNPKIAVEVMLGHGLCHVIIETDSGISEDEVKRIVRRIAGEHILCDVELAFQDIHLSENQEKGVRCADNGIFKGVPLTDEQKKLSEFARHMYAVHPFDGKYIMDGNRLIICQSNTSSEELRKLYPEAVVNPLGDWTGGIDVDTGAVNRKLGSDMADSITGGGIHGKDLSKADVSINIHAFLKAQRENRPIELCCAIGDTLVDGMPYSDIVKEAGEYIKSIGGFEKLAEWGLY